MYRYGLDVLGFLIAVVSMIGHAVDIWYKCIHAMVERGLVQ